MSERVGTNTTPVLLAIGLGGLLAASVALLPPLSACLAFLSAGVASVAVFYRRAALTLIIPVIALSPDIPILGIPVRIEDLLMVPLAAGWLASLCVFKERQRAPLDRLLIAYFLVGLAGTAWGGYLGTIQFTSLSKEAGAAFHLLKRFEFVLLFFIISDTLRTPREVQHLTYVLMASMIGLSAFGAAQFFSNGIIAEGPAGTPSHEPGLASMLNVVLALSLIPSARPAGRFILGAIGAFSMAVLPLSLGRNYVATTGLIMLYMGLTRQRWVLGLVPVILAIGLVLYPSHVVKRVESFQHVFTPDPTGTRTQGAALLSRVEAPGYYGLVALGYSPVLGLGLGSRPLGAMDSEFVTQLLYTGIAGTAIFLMLGARVFRLARNVMRAAPTPSMAGLAGGFHLIAVAYAIHSLFSPSISAGRVGAMFFVMVGLLVVLHRAASQPAGAAPIVATPPAVPEGGR
jgi:hypothetical protein